MKVNVALNQYLFAGPVVEKKGETTILESPCQTKKLLLCRNDFEESGNILLLVTARQFQ
jgi:hypothetical protein